MPLSKCTGMRVSGLTSGQRILTKDRIARGGFFKGEGAWGQRMRHRPVSSIEVSCSSRAVMPLLTTELSLLLRTPQQRLPVFFSGPDNSQNCPFLYVGGSRFHLIHGSLGRRVSPPNGLTIGSAVFAQQTDRHTTLRATCSNRPHRLLTSYLRVMPTPTLLTSWGPLVLLCRMRCVVR